MVSKAVHGVSDAVVAHVNQNKDIFAADGIIQDCFFPRRSRNADRLLP